MAVIELAEGYMTVTEAAKRAGVSRSAVYQAMREGRLPHTRITGGMTILSVRDVDSFQPRKQKAGRAATKKEREYTLEELVAGITDENRHQEVDFGPAVGNEAW